MHLYGKIYTRNRYFIKYIIKCICINICVEKLKLVSILLPKYKVKFKIQHLKIQLKKNIYIYNNIIIV